MDNHFAATNRDMIREKRERVIVERYQCGKEAIEEHDPPRTLQ